MAAGVIQASTTRASMRPPAIQAERHDDDRNVVSHPEGFNEAACNTGGTPCFGPPKRTA